MPQLRSVVLVVMVLAATVWGALVRTDDNDPRLQIAESVAADFASLATETFDDFVAAAPGAANCIGAPTLEATEELDDLATYDQPSVTIRVRVPATAPSLQGSLTHELAHHVEVACASHLRLRPTFLAAQGHAPDTAWFGEGAWEDRPSEQFAEAVVEVVLGRRSRNRLRLRLAPEAVEVVSDWLRLG